LKTIPLSRNWAVAAFILAVLVGSTAVFGRTLSRSPDAESEADTDPPAVDIDAHLRAQAEKHQAWLDSIAAIPDDIRDLPRGLSTAERTTIAEGDFDNMFSSEPGLRADGVLVGVVERFLGFAPFFSEVEIIVDRWVAVREGRLPDAGSVTVRQALTLAPVANDWESPDAVAIHAFGEAPLLPGDHVLLVLQLDSEGAWNHMSGRGTWRIVDQTVRPDFGPGWEAVTDPEGDSSPAIDAAREWFARYDGTPLDALINEASDAAARNNWTVVTGE
jgi:hypothetical protein